MSDEAKFQPGDLVKLKCGGQQMVVQATQEGGYECTWQKPDGAPVVMVYAEVALVADGKTKTALNLNGLPKMRA